MNNINADHLEIARQQIAQAWCTEKNSHKEMDSDLADACAQILANWIGSAAQYLRNEEYYRGLLDKCAEHIGEPAFIQDDGGRSESPLRAKIPELVESAMSMIHQLAAANKPTPQAGVPALDLEGASVVWEGIGGPIQQIAYEENRIYGRWDSGVPWSFLGYASIATPASPPSGTGRECEVIWRNGEPFGLVANLGPMTGLVGAEVVRMVEAPNPKKEGA